MNELQALKQAVDIALRKGAYGYDEALSIFQIIDSIANKLNQLQQINQQKEQNNGKEGEKTLQKK